MAALDNEKARYVADAASITSDVDELRCLRVIDEWYDAQKAFAQLSASDISSYSVSGRSVQRKELQDSDRTAARLLQEIYQFIYARGAPLIDTRTQPAVLTTL